MADIKIYQYGPVVTLTPETREGADWISGNLDAHDWQWKGGAVTGNPRAIVDLYERMVDDGLIVDIVWTHCTQYSS